ncbi:MAG: UDP-N-acetylmuramoyl-tripeptide--D-alanyl-D-alanine ligase [Candidatus Magasanikbacteria bacterium]
MIKTSIVYLLKYFSKKIVSKYSPDIVGITGSIGKTSTKDATAAVLSARFNVRSNVKNYNNEIGVPLTIIGFEATPGKSLIGWVRVFGRALDLLFWRDKNYPDILVLEMGADKPGDIKYLTDMAPCKVGVLTFISHAHTEFFKTIKKIAQEKRAIISHLASDGFAILNFDNDLVMENRDKTKAEIVTYGFRAGSDLRASDVNLFLDKKDFGAGGINFKVSYGGNMVPAYLPGVVAEHLVSSALAGLAVGIVFGVNLVEGIEALKKLRPIAGHMRLLPGIKNTLIIDDTYNSSPEPVKSALKTLANLPLDVGAERYAVLGDMLELGPETENAHREVGLSVAEHGIDFLITVGEASKITAKAALEGGLKEHCIASFADSVSAGKFLQEKLRTGDITLIKGSQGSRMEKIVKEVMAEPERAEELLVRQGPAWMR